MIEAAIRTLVIVYLGVPTQDVLAVEQTGPAEYTATVRLRPPLTVTLSHPESDVVATVGE